MKPAHLITQTYASAACARPYKGPRPQRQSTVQYCLDPLAENRERPHYGSNLGIVLAQLEHGPLTSSEIAELLDLTRAQAADQIAYWRAVGWLCRLDGTELQPRNPPPGFDRVRAHLKHYRFISTPELAALLDLERKHATRWLSNAYRLGFLLRESKGIYELAEAYR